MRGYVSILILVSTLGCSSPYTLQMAPSGESGDDSSVSQNLARQGYHKFIVVPASGVGGGEYNSFVSDMERELLGRGLSLISSAITGKIVKEPGKDETGKPLTDTERALVMAKNTGADAVLQIGVIEWRSVPCARFILNKHDETNHHQFVQASPQKFEVWTGPKVLIECPALFLTAKLMDVQTGEIMASFRYQSPASRYLGEDYLATYKIKSNTAVLTSNNYVIRPDGVVWNDARRKVAGDVVTSIAKKMIGGRAGE